MNNFTIHIISSFGIFFTFSFFSFLRIIKRWLILKKVTIVFFGIYFGKIKYIKMIFLFYHIKQKKVNFINLILLY